jgi:hypothetical protein
MRKRLRLCIVAVGATAVLGPLIIAAPSIAQVRFGPVASACSADITKYCARLRHGRGEIRSCLEDNRSRVSGTCRRALDTTGAGRRWR